MSYILEALKKSEQSRGHGSAPGIQTVHSAGINYRPARRSIWPWVLIAAVLLNLVVLLYFVFHKTSTAPASLPVTSRPANLPVIIKHSARPSQPALTSQSQQEPRIAAPLSQPPEIQETEINNTATVKQDQPYTAESGNLNDAVDMSELPAYVRDQIPPMKFTAHVYSTDPRQRSVVINGHYVEEGADLGNGLVLKKITTDGVIMDFQGHLFSTNVISGW